MEELKKAEGTVVPQEEVQEETPQCLHRFNAGAFVFSWIWGICNGFWGTLLLIIPYGGLAWSVHSLCDLRTYTNYSNSEMLSWLVFPLAFALLFPYVLGFSGNELAWKKQKHRRTPSEFDKSQKRWSIVGWAVLAVIAVYVIVAIVLFL